VIHTVSVATPETLLASLAALPHGSRCALIASPALLKRLSPLLDWTSAQQTIAQIFCSGGPLPAAAAQTVRELLGTVPIEVYGSSETGGVAWRQQHDQRNETPWAPLPGVSVRAEGELLTVQSPFLAAASWYVVPDRVQFVAPSAFRLLGRADRIAKIEGHRVSLAAIEQTLARSPRVHDVRVVPLPGARDRIGAVVVLARTAALTPEDHPALRSSLESLLLADELPAIAWPRHWRFVDAMPTNGMGKVTEPALIALFEP
jgi:acyl-coenzyme A synthetase/AMP-(fatty) acid ligase